MILFKIKPEGIKYEKDGVSVAKTLEVPSILAHASTAEEAIKQVKVPLVLALESLLNDGQELPGPISLNEFTGNIELQTSPENHKELALRAAESGMSLSRIRSMKIFFYDCLKFNSKNFGSSGSDQPNADSISFAFC